MPGYDAFKAFVLLDVHDDRLGVYEVWWEANMRYPEAPVSSRLAVAEAIVTDLLATSAVRLVAGPWVGADQECEQVADPAAVLREGATWVPRVERVVWIDLVD